MGRPAKFDPGSADLCGRIASGITCRGGSEGYQTCTANGHGGVLLGMFLAFALTGSRLSLPLADVTSYHSNPQTHTE